ncbi:hypothetical protein [Streptomyces sp. NBC_01530]|uniref:hypothetical protein n=1 Tax=Streptomyces sp. NBC_01530 TaxID=2903895 RepID=UPI0038676668
MPKRTGEPPHHNNLTCYTDYGCRLPECVERRNAWQRNLRRKKREGQPARVDAQPIRAHLYRLQAAGISTYRVSLIAGIDDWTVRAFMPSTTGRRARKHTTSPEIAAKILAVTPEQGTSAYIDGTGTRRRLQALVANGWPMRRLPEHLNLHGTYINDLINGRQQDRPVFAATAEKVAHAYEQLKDQKPTRHGIEARVVKRIRGLAAAKRWPTTQYWDKYPDAIGDPHFTPEYRKLRAQILAEEAAWLMTVGGLDRDQAAARLGIARFTIDRALREHPQDELETAA